MAGRRRLRSSSTRRRVVGSRARNTEHAALGGDQPSRRPGVKQASKFARRACWRDQHMGGPFVRRDILFALIDVALASLEIGFLGGQTLLAIVDFLNPRPQVAFARLKG